MAVIDRIGEVETAVREGMRDVPRSPVTIERPPAALARSALLGLAERGKPGARPADG